MSLASEIITGEFGKAKTFALPLVTFGATDFFTGASLIAGDVKISKNGGAFTNIATLPTVLGAWLIVTLSPTEMQAGFVAVQIIDQTGPKVFQDVGAVVTTTAQSWQQILYSLIESQRGAHTGVSEMIYFDPIGGNDANSGLTLNEAKLTYNFNGAGGVHSLLVDNEHQIIILLPNASGAPTVVNEYIEVDKNYTFLRGPGRDFQIEATHNEACAVAATAEGVELTGFRVRTKPTGSQDGICTTGDFTAIRKVWVDFSRGSGIVIDNASNNILEDFLIQDAAVGGSGHAVHILGNNSLTTRNFIKSGRIIENNVGANTDGIRVDGANCIHTFIIGGEPGGLIIHDNSGWGINEISGANHTIIVGPRIHLQHNTLGPYNLTGAESIIENTTQWAEATQLPVGIALEATSQDILDQVTGTGNRVITIHAQDTGTNPLQDVLVRIGDASQTTDVSGDAVFALDDGSYDVILRKQLVSFTVPESLTVSGDGTHSYTGTIITPSAPTQPDTCVVFGYVIDDGGTPVEGANILINETKDSTFSNIQKLVKNKQTTSDANGFWELEVIRSSELTPVDSPYEAIISYGDGAFRFVTSITVPDADSVEFSTIVGT